MKTKFVDRNVVLLSSSVPTMEGWDFIAQTYLDAGASSQALHANVNSDEVSPEVIIPVFGGRTCYKAYEISSKRTEQAVDYLANILKQNHGSVLEHAYFSFYLENVSRAASHEIVRHRHFSFSQESQRYVVEKRDRDIIMPPALRGDTEALKGLQEAMLETAENAFNVRDEAFDLLSSDSKRKQAAEAARATLPNAMATSMVISGNGRAWIEFLVKRLSPAADAEIQEIAQDILDKLEGQVPELFGHSPRQIWSNDNEQASPKEQK